MFLGMQDFDFAQILTNLPKILVNLPKFYQSCTNFTQICPNFAKKYFARESGHIPCIPSCYGTGDSCFIRYENPGSGSIMLSIL